MRILLGLSCVMLGLHFGTIIWEAACTAEEGAASSVLPSPIAQATHFTEIRCAGLLLGDRLVQRLLRVVQGAPYEGFLLKTRVFSVCKFRGRKGQRW